jgi:LruC domain-containing protein
MRIQAASLLIGAGLLAVGAPARAQTCVPPGAGVWGWWSGDGHALDRVGPRHGALRGATFGPGVVGQGLELDGVDDEVEIPMPDQSGLPTRITVSAWVRLDTVQSNTLFIHKINSFSLNTGGLVATGAGLFNFSIPGGGGWRNVTGTTVPQAGRYYHVVGTYDGATMKLYVDGALEGQLAFVGSVPPTSGYTPSLFFGSKFAFLNNNWRALHGALDEVVIYDHALSPGEVAAIYAAGSAGLCKDGGRDQDADGVSDAADAFPCDPSAAAAAYAPGQGAHGLLLFEDYWPYAYDLDFNDLALAYSYAYKLTADGRVTQVRLTYNALAVGGYRDLGLGLVLPVSPAAVASVTRSIGGGPAVALTPSPTDAQLTVALSGSLRADLFGAAAGIINVRPQAPVQAGLPLEVVVDLATPQAGLLALAPYDVFTFEAGQPGAEIHRPQFCGTSAMDATRFGVGVDGSNLATPRCYVDTAGLPSALHLPELAAFPQEEQPIHALYPAIATFAASGGASAQDFYLSPAPGVAAASAPGPVFPSGPAQAADLACLSTSGGGATPRSCLDILLSGAAQGDGVYWVDPDGAAGQPAFQAYCDMSTDGGGWTLFSQNTPSNDATRSLCQAAAVGALDLDGTTVSGPAKLSDALVNQLLGSGKQLMVKLDYGGVTQAVGRTDPEWDSVCVLDFVPNFTWTAASFTNTALFETPTVRCMRNTTLNGASLSPYAAGSYCGYSFVVGSTQSTTGFPDQGPYLIYSAPTSYQGAYNDDRGTCAAARAGRTWLGYGNYGCSVAKVFAR